MLTLIQHRDIGIFILEYVYCKFITFIASSQQNISYIADKTSGYLNSATKKLAANLKNGMVFPEAAPVDDQANGMTKVSNSALLFFMLTDSTSLIAVEATNKV